MSVPLLLDLLCIIDFFHINLYNNLAKPFSTVCTDPFYGQTSGPRPQKFSQTDSKLDVKSRLPKKIGKNKFHDFFLLFLKFSRKTRSVTEHSASIYNNNSQRRSLMLLRSLKMKLGLILKSFSAQIAPNPTIFFASTHNLVGWTERINKTRVYFFNTLSSAE
jgi:hypothetical protein